MDKASFEIVGNIGRVEFRETRTGKRIATLSVATSERWKRDNGDWAEKTYWHRVAIFAPAKIDRVERLAKAGTRVRIVGQVRPTSWEDEHGETRYAIEFIVGQFGEIEFLARTKPKSEEAPAPEVAEHGARKPVHRAARGKMAIAGDIEAA